LLPVADLDAEFASLQKEVRGDDATALKERGGTSPALWGGVYDSVNSLFGSDGKEPPEPPAVEKPRSRGDRQGDRGARFNA
jgi:hypothetical protein